MLKKDLDTYQRAVKTKFVAGVFSIAAAIMIAGVFYITVTQLNDASRALTMLCLASIFAMISTGWSKQQFFLGKNWSPVSKEELLEILARQINNDADAIAYIAGKDKRQNINNKNT